MNMERNSVWSEAGLPGLVLGLIPSVCFLLNQFKSDSFALNFALWALKFGGCIYLLYYFMKRYGVNHDEAAYRDIFRFGVAVALLSAIICSGFQLGYVLLIKPDMYQVAIDTLLNSGMGAQLDSNSLAALDELMPELPAIKFFADLTYCFFFGLVASSIISGSIAGGNNHSSENEQ